MKRKKLRILVILSAIFITFVFIEIATASNYEMIVNIVGESNLVGVNPSIKDLDFGDLSRSIGVERYINLYSDAKIPFYAIVLKTGELGKLVKVKESIVVVNPNQEAQLTFRLDVPFSLENRKYEGKVTIVYIPKII